MKNIDIGVVILTYKPKDEIYLSLKKILSQTIKPEKIIIVNTEEDLFYKNISLDIKNKIDKLISNEKIIDIIHIEKEEFDHGKTRNIAMSKLDTEYVLCMTDDAIAFDNMLIENMIKKFDEKTALVYAKQVPKENASYTERIVREFNYGDKDIVKTKETENEYGIKNYFCSNVCAMYDKNIFDKMSGFKENIPLNEDMLYAYKVLQYGYNIKYVSEAKVFHSHNFSFIEQFKRNYKIGLSQKQEKEIFAKIKSEKEGKKLLKYVYEKCKEEKRYFDFIYFFIECIFRYSGFLIGKNI